MSAADTLLEIKDLSLRFHSYKSVVKVIEDLHLSMRKGETLGLVGESGSGKSVTALSIMGLIPCPPGEIVSGEIWFESENLFEKSRFEMREMRGRDISMIFQNPMTSLNPVFTVGDQIVTVIRAHQGVNKAHARNRAMEMFVKVGLPDPKPLLKKHPHELSGGMCQRIMIAMALSCEPSLLIADEPTTALDVTTQAQILELMNHLKNEENTSIMLITHDLGVVAKMCEKIAVMYAGKIVEYGDPHHIFKTPGHPYTLGLLSATPIMGKNKERLETIEGNVPNLTVPPEGCRFHPRCEHVMEVCRQEVPKTVESQNGNYVSCHLIR
jgi:oligopeptide/dipeptide ABC transporter ATP-binding protein